MANKNEDIREEEETVAIEYNLNDKDNLEMYKYYQDKATSVKGAMFKTTTWIIGFAAALIAFLFASLTKKEYSPDIIPPKLLMVLVSIAGIVISVYALFAIYESAKHIKNNWKFSEHYAKKIGGLREVVLKKYAQELPKKDDYMEIWTRLSLIVYAFIVAFILILVFSCFI